jgi:branched-chain amino acid transport system permease protein
MPRQIWLALLGLLLIILPFGLKGYTVYILSIAGANILAAVGLNLLMGYAGQVSIGQAAFLAIGGYTSALLMTKLGLSFWLAFPLAGMLTSLTGLILFIPALRLGTIYLAIATLGFGAAVQQLIPLPYWSAILGGHQGIRVPRPQIGSFVFDTDLELYYLTLVIVVVLLVLSWNVARSYIGRAFIALRDKPAAAEALGINPTRYKAYAFLVSAFLTGIAGALQAHLVGHISPGEFGLGKSIEIFAMVILGGIGSLPGSVLGAVFLTFLPHWLSEARLLYTFLYGAALVLVIIFMPYGVWGFFLRLYYRFPAMQKLFPKGA